MKNQGESKNRNNTFGSLEFKIKFWKDKVLENLGKLIKSLFSKHLIGVSNVTGVHVALYWTWWCDPPGGVQGQNPKSSSYLKVFKAWK